MTAAMTIIKLVTVFAVLQCAWCGRLLDLSYADWTLSSADGGLEFNATVPGGVYSDLRRANFLDQELFYRFNDQSYRWVANENWTYSTEFSFPSYADKSSTMLVFEGVDTVSEIWLNGQLLGTTDNMFTVYRFPVSTALKIDGVNHLDVRFQSPIEAAKKLASVFPHKIPSECWPTTYHGECHVNLLRKMQASFAWDWGPAFPSLGIWKTVTLERAKGPALAGIATTVRAEGSSWSVKVTAWLDNVTGDSSPITSTIGENKPGILGARLRGDNGEAFSFSKECSLQPAATSPQLFSADITLSVPKEKVKEWWPNGMGQQKLYPLEVIWKSDADVQIRTISVGFRTVELVQQPVNVNNKSQGLSFYFSVNGVEVFAKGSNWIPSDILPEKSNDMKRINWLLESAADANFNMLRVWGGGLYESDDFYRRCDELGIMVWQDLMFACNMYPAEDNYLNGVRKEIYQQVARLQHHPSIVLWAGNNENEAALRQDWYGTKQNFSLFQKEYIKLYVDTIRPIIREMDPSRPFLVSSPSNGPESEQENYIAVNPQSTMYGDVHFYNYMGDLWNPEIFPRPRFASEYGVQSLPSMSTLQNVATKSDLALGSSWWNSRQHQANGWIYMKVQLSYNFPPYNTIQQAIYYSQVHQAVSIQTETEHYRRMKNSLFDTGEGRTMGALYWQLNDVWQAPSWSSIDYSGKWKLLHYAAKKFMAPVITSSYMTPDERLSVWGVSDSLVDVNGAVLNIFLRSVDHFVPLKITTVKEINLEANMAKQLYTDDIESMLKSCPNEELCFFEVTLSNTMDGKITTNSYVFPTKLKDMPLPPANVRISGFQKTGPQTLKIRLTTDAPALFVWLDSQDSPGAFSDNGFHMTESTMWVTFNFQKPANNSVLMKLLKELTITHMATLR